jgi:hypothetical protein
MRPYTHALPSGCFLHPRPSILAAAGRAPEHVKIAAVVGQGSEACDPGIHCDTYRQRRQLAAEMGVFARLSSLTDMRDCLRSACPCDYWHVLRMCLELVAEMIITQKVVFIHERRHEDLPRFLQLLFTANLLL